jgi:hypothetical protein
MHYVKEKKMKDDELIALVTECGLTPWVKHEYIGGTLFSATDEGIDGDLAGLIQFAKLVAKHAIAQDREAVALLIEKRGAQGYGTLAIAAEVRADNACSTLCHPEEPCFITEDGMCTKRGSHGQT